MTARRRSTPRVSRQQRPPAVRNLLLASLPKADRDRIVPTLDIVPLKLREFLHQPADRIDYVYFPCGGFCSVVAVLEDGSMVEVATIGREGVVGVTAVLDGPPIASAAMVQGASEKCYRMAASAFRREMDRRGAFYVVLTRYSHALVGFVMQSAACNAAHTVEQRLARWLLMAHDRMAADEFPLTQEFAAMMLGATRPTVSIVAATLQRAGLITYRRGRVRVLDRRKLEAASCECYRVATNLFQRLPSPRSFSGS